MEMVSPLPTSIFAKAFDSVSHQKLLYKLLNYGISGNLLEWIKNFLSERLQCTKVGNTLSPYIYLTSGVIQGSCLGPLLFVIYINDVVSLFGHGCVCKLYADDLKLYMRMNSTHCAAELQNSLDRLAYWSQMWQLSISYKKCAVMQLDNNNSSRTDHSYTVASNPITNVDVVKDLGIFVDKSLTFSNHICHIVTRAFTRANLIHKCFFFKAYPYLGSSICCLRAAIVGICITYLEPTSSSRY